jgi:hypothetical protein
MNTMPHFVNLLPIGYFVFLGVGYILTAWVLYMFYARLRDIADELKKMRISFQTDLERRSRIQDPRANVFSQEARDPDERYMPEKG